MTDTDKCNSCPLHHRTCPACGGGLSGHAAGDSGGPGVKKSVLVSQCLACGWEARTEVTWPPTERIEQAKAWRKTMGQLQGPTGASG